MSAFKNYCINVFSHVRPQATFLSVKGYNNNWSEISDFNIIFKSNYLNAVESAKERINNATCPANALFNNIDFNLAKDELLKSFDMTLAGYNPLYTCHGVYKSVLGADGNPITGVKLHKRLDEIHINGICFKKRVIVPGHYENRDSSPYVIAKNYLRSLTSLGSWVQFKLVPQRFTELAVQKMRILG